MPAPDEASLYPLFLKLAGRPVLVVGAGNVAERKISALRDAGARVSVVAPGATEPIQRWARQGDVEWRARPFEESDVLGAWLIVAATSSEQVQRHVAEVAEARRLFCVAVDDPPNASAYSGGVVRRHPFTIAISSSGAAPALTRLVREVAESILPNDGWIERATALRARWAARGTPMADRFAELVRELKSPGGDD